MLEFIIPRKEMADKFSALPYSLGAEQSFLGCVIVDQEIQLDMLSTIGEEDFYTESHKLIIRAMKEIIRQNKSKKEKNEKDFKIERMQEEKRMLLL